MRAKEVTGQLTSRRKKRTYYLRTVLPKMAFEVFLLPEKRRKRGGKGDTFKGYGAEFMALPGRKGKRGIFPENLMGAPEPDFSVLVRVRGPPIWSKCNVRNIGAISLSFIINKL